MAGSWDDLDWELENCPGTPEASAESTGTLLLVPPQEDQLREQSAQPPAVAASIQLVAKATPPCIAPSLLGSPGTMTEPQQDSDN